MYTGTARSRADAQAIANAFAQEVARVRGTPLAPPPTVQVRNTPQLIFFRGDSNQVVVPWWDTAPPGMRSIFTTFAGGDAAAGEQLFRAFFNRFNIAHEMGHWFMARAGRREATQYDAENMANRWAVAFWRTQPDGERYLAMLEQMAARAADNLTDPTPAGQDPATYFGANYQALGREPLKYGYYQFRFTRDALRDRAQLDFAQMVRDPQAGR
ncbi:MAG TPA: hypothetical protein VF665_20420 [Longimicrobium sp.]|uniref:ImmA/IrrE family metallo-endopeptidase n=1 Tax=Longimicrobium sp. TaxID=2029185 RepID=UPI002ED9AC78